MMILSTATFSLAQLPAVEPVIVKQPEPLDKVQIEQKLGSMLPLETVFKDEAGGQQALGTFFKDKPVIMAFVYYECPMLCTLVLNGLVKALRVMKLEVGKDFEVVLISIDPGETPELAKQKKEVYTKIYKREGAEQGWHFLTGDEPAIQVATDAAGFRYVYDEKADQYAHASAVMILTPEGRMARYYYGIEYSPRDLRFGLVEASQNRIGTFIDQILLYCFHYDAATGKYSLMIMRVLRTLGLMTILLMGFTIFYLLKRERKGT